MKVIPHLLSTLGHFDSVLDIGCGRGAWLKAFNELGVEDIIGVEGSSDAADGLMIPSDFWINANLTHSLVLDRKFDLVVCLEVAEHLPEDAHPILIETLTRHSDVVLFSAAVPLQGGTGHIAERWPNYWANLFRSNFFNCYDLLRPQIWSYPDIEFWYRQNILIFIRSGSEKKFSLNEKNSVQEPLALIHPEQFLWALRRDGSLSDPSYRLHLKPVRDFMKS
jgi:SAM-dependent methyltransferase